jgi:hypothetical protein
VTDLAVAVPVFFRCAGVNPEVSCDVGFVVWDVLRCYCLVLW